MKVHVSAFKKSTHRIGRFNNLNINHPTLLKAEPFMHCQNKNVLFFLYSFKRIEII